MKSMSPKAIPDQAVLGDLSHIPSRAVRPRLSHFPFWGLNFAVFPMICSMSGVDPLVPHILWIEHEEN